MAPTQHQEEVAKGLQSMQAGLNRLTIALIGDPEFNVKGIITEVQEMKAEQAQQKTDMQNIKNSQYKQSLIVGGAGAGIGAILTAFGKMALTKIGLIKAGL